MKSWAVQRAGCHKCTSGKAAEFCQGPWHQLLSQGERLSSLTTWETYQCYDCQSNCYLGKLWRLNVSYGALDCNEEPEKILVREEFKIYLKSTLYLHCRADLQLSERKIPCFAKWRKLRKRDKLIFPKYHSEENWKSSLAASYSKDCSTWKLFYSLTLTLLKKYQNGIQAQYTNQKADMMQIVNDFMISHFYKISSFFSSDIWHIPFKIAYKLPTGFLYKQNLWKFGNFIFF